MIKKDIRKAAHIAEVAAVSVEIPGARMTQIIDEYDQLVVHLLEMIGATNDALAYAPDSDAATEGYNKMVAARKFLTDECFEGVTRDVHEGGSR